jgi:endoglucanase
VTTQELIKRIFSCPTAPFREQWVSDEIQLILTENKIPYFIDRFGNIIAGAKNSKQTKGSRLVFMAHMDHPGFHVNSLQAHDKGSKIKATFWGGAPFDKMKGARVRIYDPVKPGFSAVGIITDVEPPQKNKRGRSIKIETPTPLKLSKTAFGAFDYPGFNFRGNRLSARVCDDLTGVVIALGALIENKKSNALAVFTRAEEVGFIGCWSSINKSQWDKKNIFISLEASLNLPGARLGKGPVIRMGDRSTMFNSPTIRFMENLALELKKKDSTFNYQKRILDGGSCEATALGLFEYAAAGISVPLFNYHNMARKGAGPEVVDFRDVENARKLCSMMVKRTKNYLRIAFMMKTSLTKNHKALEPMLFAKNEFQPLKTYKKLAKNV